MNIAVPAEIKTGERRVALTPQGARELVRRGHRVVVEAGAGAGSGFSDDAYALAGAHLHGDAAEVWAGADLVVKVKEPVPGEYGHFREDLCLFTYLHLAPNRPLTEALVRSGITAIAYETVRTADGRLPLLTPMSEIAGRLAALAGAHHLQTSAGGPGVLVTGAPGVPAGRVLVIGGGVVGTNAAQVAVGMGADVTVLERSVDRLRTLEQLFGNRARVLMSDVETLRERALQADVIIGAVLVHGALAPRLLTRTMLADLRRGAVLVDVAIDQGGCFETSRPTTHEEPIFTVDGVVHYCVANMPGAVPWTSTRALAGATLPYLVQLADGVDEALRDNPSLAEGLNVRSGEVLCAPVVEAMAVPA